MENERKEEVRQRLSSSRSAVVAVLLGFGTVVMGRELYAANPAMLAGAVGVGIVLLALLPAPRDLRSMVYALFVPVTMTYGAVLEEIALLVLGAAAGGLFLLEKTRGLRGEKETPP